MNDIVQKKAAKQFAKDWEGKGYEKGQSQAFWLSLLHKVFGVNEPEKYIEFEDKVFLGHTSFIDGYISETKVLIEQKSLGKDLNKPIKQSDGVYLTPFQQAEKYISKMNYSKIPRWVITCNFEMFYVYDMEKRGGEPEVIYLKDLEKEYYRLSFLVDSKSETIKKEEQVSMAAGDIVGEIYDAFSKQYVNPDDQNSLKSLNVLCVRIVFCLYAEDAGLFGSKNMFHDYLIDYETRGLRRALKDLFKVLDTKPEDRDPYLKDDNSKLAAFPYVNGGLFADEEIEIPPFTDEIKDLLIKHASSDFDWSEISPTIFGAVFESTLNPETRRAGGMHYTSIATIHKVIDPLFMDALEKEFNEILQIQISKTRISKLEKFQNKLASLTFLDPACGSGNFLTESYLSLRKLENKVIRAKIDGQMYLVTQNPIKVSIKQFYGIEINDFAVTVGKTALWIAESQMLEKTKSIVYGFNEEFLPLKTYVNIVEANAVMIDWEDIIPKYNLNYIMGNPPFVGFTYMKPDQKKDMQYVFPGLKNLDYVCAWYKKASDYIVDTDIEVAYVSTNSIVQGETVSRLWSKMQDDIINFAYRTFVWDSEANSKAQVHCVIISFSKKARKEKIIFDNGNLIKAKNINPYLFDGDDILIESRNNPICNVPKMIYGNKPADGGNLIIEESDYENFIISDPKSKKFIKPLLGAAEYIRGKKRWCLWLDGADPGEIRECPLVIERVRKCKESRENSVAAGIRKFALTPTLFAQRTQPVDSDFVIIPRVSSQNRRYVPMGFIKQGTIVTDAVQIIPNASLYNFGILISNVHMAWMRTVCGRLKSDYRYSKDIVYNNFPWPIPSSVQKERIEKTAQGILDARKLYPNSSLADIYDELTMPSELRRAHQLNDKAVMEAYGITSKSEEYKSESACVTMLMNMYKELTEK